MKRACALACLLCALMLLAGASAESAELLENGGFETLTASGAPAGWYTTAYREQEGYSRLAVTSEKAHSGQYSVMVENASLNDARYTYTVKVEPSSMYRLSGYVLVESMEDVGNGANFGIEGLYAFSECLYDTNGEWQYLEWYGETGENQTEVTIGVRVGGYSAESVGKAYFDDMSLVEVATLPTGIVADLWYVDAAASVSQPEAQEEDEPQKSTALFVALAVVFLLAALLMRPPLGKRDHPAAPVAFAVVMLAALIVRVFLAMSIEGYSVDIGCFTAWSLRMAQNGPVGFYAEDYFCDYPPGYMLILWPCGLLLNAVGLSNTGVSLLIVKLVPIVCDLLGAFAIYAFAKKRLGNVAATALAALYALNPAVLVNGAAWGQADSVLALFIVAAALLASERKWSAAIPVYLVSVLVKPQAILFAPVGGVWLLYCLFQKQTQKERTAQLCRRSSALPSGLRVLRPS